MLGYSAEEWRVILFGIAAFLQTTFVLLYLTFPWYETFLGRALFGKALSLAVVMDVFLASHVFGLGAPNAMFLVLYVVLILGIGAQTLAFLRVRLAGRQNEVSGNAPTHEMRRW